VLFFKQLTKKIRLLVNKNVESYRSIHKITGFYPDNIELYQQAFLHRSLSLETDSGIRANNERLEFLGDAILSCVITDILYRRFPKKREGFLTNARSKIVQRDSLNYIALKLGIDKMLRFSVRNNIHSKSIYGNALEALIGAIYIDKGYECCFNFVNDVIIGKHVVLEEIAHKEVNFKSNLIEWGQKNKIDITFNLLKYYKDRDGFPIFETAAYIGERQIGLGIGHSKKESQQNAAKMAAENLHTDSYTKL
jgi:ribonuclease-3